MIAVTATGVEGDERKAIEAGCDAYITKPIASGSFLESISRLVEGTSGDRHGGARADPCDGRRANGCDHPVKVLAGRLRDPGGLRRGEKPFEGPRGVARPRPPGRHHAGRERLRGGPAPEGDLRTVAIPIIMVTGLNDPHDKALGLEAGRTSSSRSRSIPGAPRAHQVDPAIEAVPRADPPPLPLRGKDPDGSRARRRPGGTALGVLLASTDGGLADMATLLNGKGFATRTAQKDRRSSRSTKRSAWSCWMAGTRSWTRWTSAAD